MGELTQPFKEPSSEGTRATIERLWDVLLGYNQRLGTFALNKEERGKLDALDSEWAEIDQQVRNIGEINEADLLIVLARLQEFTTRVKEFIAGIESKT